MSVFALPDYTISKNVIASTDDVTLELIACVPLKERSLIVLLLARSFLDMLRSLNLGMQQAQIISWIDKSCDAHSEMSGVKTLFLNSCKTILSSSFIFDNLGLDVALILALEPKIEHVANKKRDYILNETTKIDHIDAAINAMIVKLEKSDPLTAEHSRAVSAWCSRIARRMTLSEEDVLFVARCGLVHDVGKVTTPVEILHAPRKLTDDEWLVMRDHSSAGYLLVTANPNLSNFAHPVRAHHERLDGKGYPDKLGPESISLFTRIVTVADCFNAMIGRRPYRLPMTPAAALSQLETHKGLQFDADIVAVMHEVVLAR